MNTHLSDSVQSASCDDLLLEVNRVYQEMETLLLHIQNELVNATGPMIENATDALNSLKDEARTVDSLIADCLRKTPYPTESARTLLEKRNNILRTLSTANINLLTQAENIKVLVRHELGNLSKNQTALKGYMPIDNERQYMVRGTF